MEKTTSKNYNLDRMQGFLEQRTVREKEIKELYRVITDETTCKKLLSGRDYWIKVYSRKVTEYRAFCIKHALYAQSFINVKGLVL